MSWSTDFKNTPKGNMPFLAKRDIGKKVRYAVCTKAPVYYAESSKVANCIICGVGKGFAATHWRPLPADDERSDNAIGVLRHAVMDIAAGTEPKARERASRALDELRNYKPNESQPQ